MTAATTDSDDAATGVTHGSEIRRFARASLSNDHDAITAARDRLIECGGPEHTASVAGVVAVFNGINRVVSATGLVVSDDYVPPEGFDLGVIRHGYSEPT